MKRLLFGVILASAMSVFPGGDGAQEETDADAGALQ